MESKHLLAKGLAICAGLAAILAVGLTAVHAAQVQLPGSAIPQFVDPLPGLSVAGGPVQTIIAGKSQVELHMREFKANVMPSTFVPGSGSYDGTWVWGYINGATAPSTTQGTYIGPVIV